MDGAFKQRLYNVYNRPNERIIRPASVRRCITRSAENIAGQSEVQELELLRTKI